MYLGIVVTFLALPLVLASWWSSIPAAIIVGLFVYRTNREEQMLRAGLPGYEDYARRVRFRILPGVW
jgi:protein-S-isoprenylcysteine O-methyltransferase Ste14